jgi:hypothetical protein
MIYNLFAYPSNFGKVSIAKCDYFGNKLTSDRSCFVNKFTVNVEQQNYDDNLLFGSFNQTPNFKIGNTKISINTEFIFSINHSGLLDPAIDLLFNLSSWSFQGTNISYKLTVLGNPTNSYLSYLERNIIQSIGLSLINLSCFEFFIVNNSSNIKLNVTSIDNASGTLYYNTVNGIGQNSWLEIFKRADPSNLQPFPIYSEPMFRIDSSEGSF